MATATLTATSPEPPPAAPSTRLAAIDVLRGLVMVIMALDHTRDFFWSAPFDPTDLAHTTPLLFYTRWITHFAAPVFVLLAGTGAFLWMAKHQDKAQLSRFLVTRGLWLVVLEIAVIGPLGWAFSFDFHFIRLQVIWVIGLSMMILGGLIQLMSPRVLAAFGLILIIGHNLFDGPHAAWFGPLAGTWKLLHSFSLLPLAPGHIVASLYPLIPWVGVMALGYGAGEIALLETGRRRRVLLTTGLVMIGLFALLRGLNLYGDPRPWVAQSDGLFSFLAVLNGNKYPPSLSYLLMTLGPALCFLAVADRLPTTIQAVLSTYGRVPLFYYLLHLPLLHGAAVVFSYIRYGQAPWLFQDLMALRHSPHPLPAGYGYDLGIVYLVWLAAVAVLYPACRWFGEVKRTARSPWLSYL